MPKFRKRPVVIEAVRFEPDPARPSADLPDGVDYCGTSDNRNDHHWSVRTLEGRMRIQPGDWLITGVAGERYPCKPDIFAATYESASESVDSEIVAAREALPEALDEIERLRDALRIAMIRWARESSDIYERPYTGERKVDELFAKLSSDWTGGLVDDDWAECRAALGGPMTCTSTICSQPFSGQPSTGHLCLAQCRAPVRRFALRMEAELSANDHKGGWQGDGLSDLLERLLEEADELDVAIAQGQVDQVVKEAADVANFAMMIADNVRSGR